VGIVHDKEARLSVNPAHMDGPVRVLQMSEYPVGPVEMNFHVLARREHLDTFMDINLRDLMGMRLMEQHTAIMAPADQVLCQIVDVILPAAVVL